MPELPEVETTRRGIEPLLLGRTVDRVVVHDPRLRWPVPATLARALAGRRVEGVRRRAKYLLIETAGGALIMHLGMSGSLRVLGRDAPAGPHDRVDLVLSSGRALRLRDPRRFGAVLWTEDDPAGHPLLARLGPEPLDPGFDGAWLHARARGRRAAVKSFLMDGHIVVGVGNIYASEALHLAGVHPSRAAGRISRPRYERVAEAVRAVLEDAITEGGTTLRDFTRSDGTPGYFRTRLRVYGRAGEPCPACAAPVRRRVIGQRSTFYCPRCQR